MAARHGSKMGGKLARIAEADRALAERYEPQFFSLFFFHGDADVVITSTLLLPVDKPVRSSCAHHCSH